jgi:hypothetical protein
MTKVVFEQRYPAFYFTTREDLRKISGRIFLYDDVGKSNSPSIQNRSNENTSFSRRSCHAVHLDAVYHCAEKTNVLFLGQDPALTTSVLFFG